MAQTRGGSAREVSERWTERSIREARLACRFAAGPPSATGIAHPPMAWYGRWHDPAASRPKRVQPAHHGDPPGSHHQAELAARKLAGERISRIIASPYTRALQTAEPLARRLGLKIEIHTLVRERFGLACDIGTARSRLASAWPRHDFSHLDEKWWPDEHEGPDEVTGRAAAFRRQMTAEANWPETVVVSHWGFILCMTGQNINNGETIRCDPTGPIPEQFIWRA
jgi:broad specificity phosphatase PhoE